MPGEAPTQPAGRGTGRATIRDVAAHAGVSVATVSRILNGTYSAPTTTVDKVMQAVAELDYVANASARALTTTKTKTIGIVVPSLNSPFFMNVAAGIEEQAHAEGYLCIVASTHNDPARELSALGMMRERGVDAVVLTGGGSTRPPEHEARVATLARSLYAAGSRLVLCARSSFEPSHNVPAIWINFDNVGGAYAATSHLLAAGHTRIAYLGGREAHTFTRGRIAGYRKALHDHGLDDVPELVDTGPMIRSAVRRRTTALLENAPGLTAIFAATDYVAASAIAALGRAGLKVPDDVSIVGYNDDPMASDLLPALTTVHVPQAELGRLAIRQALHDPSAATDNEPVVLGTHIVVRESVSAPRSVGHRPVRPAGSSG